MAVLAICNIETYNVKAIDPVGSKKGDFSHLWWGDPDMASLFPSQAQTLTYVHLFNLFSQSIPMCLLMNVFISLFQ